MKKIFINFYRYLSQFRFNINGLKSFFGYIKDYFEFKKKSNKSFKIYLNYPCLHDKDDMAGSIHGHYFYQDLHVAQRIFQNNPTKHIDIGSRVDGFVTHVASFREIEVFDIRLLESKKVKNIIFKQLDIMKDIPNEYQNYTDSLSCLHTIEHFGLGRYGDSIDYDGHITGFNNIIQILKPGGVFYFSTPIGEQQKIEFNAHRIFSLGYLINTLISDKFDIMSFSYVDDQGDLHTDIELNENAIKYSFNLQYGCGIFELRKK